MNRAIKIALLALVLLPLTYLAEAAISLSFVPRSQASLPPFLFADPRDYGATCAAGTFDVNDGTHDDAPGFNLALATGLPVVIPWPGCKWVTSVVAPADGATIFTFGGAGPYDALSTTTNPYIFVPSANTATYNCIFDTKGLEGVTWRYVTVKGWDRSMGTSTVCDSVGIANGRPQAFTTLDHVSISGMGNAIGGAMDANCAPHTYTVDLAVPVFQLDINNLKVGHTCFGMYANYSDTHIQSMYMANIYNDCIASPGGGGAYLEISDGRCEYTGHFDANPVLFDGAGIYLSGVGGHHLTNMAFDHTFGSCITVDGADNGSGSQVALSNIQCLNSGTGGAVSEGGVITNQCNFVLENQAGYLSAVNMQAEGFTTMPKYNMCFVGTQQFSITWEQSGGDSGGGGGWRTAEFNGTLPVGFRFDAAQSIHINNDLLTSCTSQPTGTWQNNSGVVTVCP